MTALRARSHTWARARGRFLGPIVVGGGIALTVCLIAAIPALAGGTPPRLLPVPSPSVPAVTPPTLPVVSPSLSPLPTLPAPTPPSLLSPSPPLVSPPATPSLPVSLYPSPTPPGGGTPTPSGSPSPSPAAAGGVNGKPPPSGAAGGGAPGAGGWPGIPIPFTGLVASPLDIALLAAIAVLPLLGGIWMLLFGRAWSEARRARAAQIRLAIASELGLRPRELVSLSTAALFKLREEAAFDELTGVLRRAAGMSALDREIARARRQRSPLSVAFVDVDGLKRANDQRGHKAGDELLKSLSSVLKNGLRGQDLVARYGGDEFVCVLPDTAVDAARAKLSSIQAESGKAGVGFSFGVAQLEGSEDLVSLLARADREMYSAKARRGATPQLRIEPPIPSPSFRPESPDLNVGA